MTTYEEVESQDAFNTAVAAGGIEAVFTATQRSPNFNKLLVQNTDVVDINIYLDTGGSAVAGRRYKVPKNSVFSIDPATENINFINVTQENLDAVSAETANKILFRVAYARPVS